MRVLVPMRWLHCIWRGVLDKENGEAQLRAWMLTRWVLKLVIVSLLFSNKVTSYLYTLLIWLVRVLIGYTGN